MAVTVSRRPSSRRSTLHIHRMGRVLIVIGVILVAIGVLWPLLRRIGLGRLPGDIYIRGQHGAFYFPIVTCIVVSVALSLLFWLLNR